jgi:hypothetical protein
MSTATVAIPAPPLFDESRLALSRVCDPAIRDTLAADRSPSLHGCEPLPTPTSVVRADGYGAMRSGSAARLHTKTEGCGSFRVSTSSP